MKNPTKGANGPRGGVVQHRMIPLGMMMGPPPPLPFMIPPPHFHDHHDDFLDEPEEDPFAVIEEMQRSMREKRRNSPMGGIFGSGGMGRVEPTPTIHTKPDLHPALAQDLESGVPHFDPAEVTEKAQHNAYNDSN